MKKQALLTTVSILSLSLVGCATQGQRPVYHTAHSVPTVANGATHATGMDALAGPAGPEAVPYAASNEVVMLEKLSADMNALYQRMQRAERAMIRLDRRMQLIERNELGRMGANTFSTEEPVTRQQLGAVQPMAEPMQQISQVPPQAKSYPAGMVPVVASLQPAQKPLQGQRMASLSAGNRLPSLADEPEDAAATPGMAVWTVRYIDGKVWPDRNQLPASRQVVSALRSGQPVALFARGAQPNSKEFRERVRALSRYLSKVSESEKVAISAMPAQHLDSDTIEIFATQ